MPIKVYGSVTSRKPDEVYQAAGVTLSEWLAEQTEDYRPGPVQPVTIMIDGELIDPDRWSDVTVSADDQVDIRVRPQGGVISDAFESIGGFLVNPFFSLSFRAGNAALNSFIPDIPGQTGGGRQGSNLSPAELKANTARLNEVIPEVLGRHIRYPDYLNPPRRLYSDTRTQVLRLMLCVGVGDYEIDEGSIKIGETAIEDLNNIDFEIFGPGEDVSGSLNHEHWYTAPEVGSTQASSGIRLRGVTLDERTYSGSANAFASLIGGIDIGERWEAGLRGTIALSQPVTVAGNVITGTFEHLLVGMEVTVGDTAGLSGNYVVASLNGAKTELELETLGGAAVTPTAGSWPLVIDKAGTEYVLTIINEPTITVERVLAGGAEDTDWSGSLPSGTDSATITWLIDTFSGSTVGPFPACPDGETTQNVEVDIFAPQGLGTIDEDRVNSRSREIRLKWRPVGSSTWTTQVETVTGATRNQLGWTFSISLPSAIRPEIEIERNGGEDVALEALDRIEVTELRSKLSTKTSYPGVTTMAVTITGADEIGSQSNNRINLIPVRKLPTWDGSGWTSPQATRDISAALVYTAKTVGYTDDDIDLDELDRLHTIWDNRGDRFDHQFGATTVKTAMDVILRAGMAELTIMGGLLTPARDEPRTQFEQPYSPANMTGPLQRSFQTVRQDDFDGVEVEYINSDTWTTETVLCLLPGDQGIKLDKMKLDGVTDRTRAWRIGMRRRRAQKYRRWTYSFQTELDALNSGYLSCVPLIDDIPGYGKAAIMRDIQEHTDGALVTVTEPMEWVDGENHVIAYRDENGDLAGPFTATQGDTDDQIIADIPLPWPDVNARQEPPHVFFGTTEKWTFPALVQDVTPNGSERCSVQAVNYDGRVYDDDDNSPP